MSELESIAPPALTQDNAKYLDWLAIAYYVIAAITALCGCFPIIHVVIGGAITFAPQSTGSGGDQPPKILGIGFMIIGLLVILAFWVMAGLVAYVGKCLKQRRHWMFCMVIAAILCFNVPHGTVLGVLTLVVLLRPDVKAAFGRGRE